MIRNDSTHAILDSHSRVMKAKKIAFLASNYSSSKFEIILEVGVGSGYISHYFSKLEDNSQVSGVDVFDDRQVYDGYDFALVTDTSLPFFNDTFDFVISNHVIEHVGDYAEQKKHLKEIFRCLKDDGWLYIAVPNKWRFIEPHYRMPFLSWFPQYIADAMVKASGKAKFYDCRPLSFLRLQEILEEEGFNVHDVSLNAVDAVALIEHSFIAKLIGKMPLFLKRLFLKPFLPTIVFLCSKNK